MRSVKSSKSRRTYLKLIPYFKSKKITGWRLNDPIFVFPDFMFPKKKSVINTDGCFWHGQYCQNTQPKENADFWDKKRAQNPILDLHVLEQLPAKGLTIIVKWQCEVKKGLLKKHYLS